MPGDIVSFGGQGHVGIYLGRGLYVHSPQSGDVVRVQRVRDHLNFDGVIRIG
jgi:cell wall-associated NlpC family hydrolase